MQRHRHRSPRGSALGLLAGGLGLILSATPARAGEVTITTQLGSWDEAVAVLRADTYSHGRTIRVAVHAGEALVPCERYVLQLDEAASNAFRMTGCDPSTQETSLVLAHRAALFDEGHDVPRARPIAVTAILRVTEVATGGPQGGSLVRCSVAVRPYLDDVLHGTRVMLTPERYALRPGSVAITVTPEPGGWSLSTTERASFRFRYDVVDRATGEVVLHEDASISCGSDALERDMSQPEARQELLREARQLRDFDHPMASPAAPARSTALVKASGATALASLFSLPLWWLGFSLDSDRRAQAVFLAGAVASNVALAVSVPLFVYSLRKYGLKKPAATPVVAFSGRGATVGAQLSF